MKLIAARDPRRGGDWGWREGFGSWGGRSPPKVSALALSEGGLVLLRPRCVEIDAGDEKTVVL